MKTHWEPDSEDDFEGFARRRLPYTKLEFPKFSGGDPRGWILKAEKYFRYHETPEELKVDVASMNLEGDALDLFAFVNQERTVMYWDELVKALQECYGPPEFQNPDEFLCGIKQTSSVHEYRLEFARRSARVRNWPDHCLLGVFINGLKEELKAEIRIHKPKTVYRATSLALEYEAKLNTTRGHRPTTSTTQNRSFQPIPARENYSSGTLAPSSTSRTPSSYTGTRPQSAASVEYQRR